LLEGKVPLLNNSQYAYGFFDRRVHGQRVVGHGGGFPGICSILSMYPELEYTVIVLTNSDNDCRAVDEFIAEMLLK